MSKTSKSSEKRVFAGLSTGRELAGYARSILEQVCRLSKSAHIREIQHRRSHVGVEPMLLALAMELALKAWFVWDYDRKDPIKTHDLAKLYHALPEASQEKLNPEFKKRVAPLHPWSAWMDYSMRDILEHHANAFVEWRYLHEDREDGISFDFTTFIATLELILDEFEQRYTTRRLTSSGQV